MLRLQRPQLGNMVASGQTRLFNSVDADLFCIARSFRSGRNQQCVADRAVAASFNLINLSKHGPECN
jgi:hypothetical protein